MGNFGKIAVSRSSNGKTDITIVDDSHIPLCFYLSNFMDKDISQVLNTKKTYANHLLFIYRYFQSKQIDIPSRVIEGKFFTTKEYNDFRRHCTFKGADWMKESSNISSFQRFNDKQLDKVMYASTVADETVASSTIRLRLSLFKQYVENLYNKYHFTAKPDSDVQYKFDALSRQIKGDIKGIKDQNEKTVDPFDSEIPSEIYESLKECIEPGSPNNPFLSSRLRNYLIVTIAMEGGLRRGAIAKLKLGDVIADWNNPRLRITKTPNDEADSRKNKPSQKTKAHVCPISKRTMEILKKYIEDVRSDYDESEKHEFVFVSEKGNVGEPLSLRGYDYVFEILSKHLDFHITAHMLRHKWNEEFDVAAEELGYKGEAKEDVRKGAMGWNESSQMGAIYNAKRLSESAQRIQQEMQRECNGQLKSDTCLSCFS